MKEPLMPRVALALTIVLTLSGCVETKTCSIQVPLSTPPKEYPHLARVSREKAESTARDRLNTNQLSHATSKLEALDGCLVWSVQLQLPGEPGAARVHVDAGDGSVLLVKHETQGPWFYE